MEKIVVQSIINISVVPVPTNRKINSTHNAIPKRRYVQFVSFSYK